MLRINNYNSDYIGYCYYLYGGQKYKCGLYRCNGWIACVSIHPDEKNTENAVFVLQWFFNDADHAKRMLGIIGRHREENALIDFNFWHLKPCKDSEKLFKLLLDATGDGELYACISTHDSLSHEQLVREATTCQES